MEGIPGTPCCVQLSIALVRSGISIPEKSNRRLNGRGTIQGHRRPLLFCVDEVIDFLSWRFGKGLELKEAGEGTQNSYAAMKRKIAIRQGILAFYDLRYGFHVELWNGRAIHQRDIDERFCFGQPKVFFWECGTQLENLDFSELDGL
jgi:Type VI secretion system (T6SS), amidase effector protein 4